MFTGTPSLAMIAPISFDQYGILLMFLAASSDRCSGAYGTRAGFDSIYFYLSAVTAKA
jgi:hypothetical protein